MTQAHDISTTLDIRRRPLRRLDSAYERSMIAFSEEFRGEWNLEE